MENFDVTKLISTILQKPITPELSIILPCRNEEQAIIHCLNQILDTLEKSQINAEVIISDSSSDSTPSKVKQFVHRCKWV